MCLWCAASSKDGQLFRIMLEHWDQAPPAAALGVSAKFHADGRSERGRYHVALALPCALSGKAHVAASAAAAASVLKAPPLVHAWAEVLGDEAVVL